MPGVLYCDGDTTPQYGNVGALIRLTSSPDTRFPVRIRLDKTSDVRLRFDQNKPSNVERSGVVDEMVYALTAEIGPELVRADPLDMVVVQLLPASECLHTVIRPKICGTIKGLASG